MLASLPLMMLCLLMTYALAAGVDGIWLHLIRYRLHARPETRSEHGLHTVRAWLFPVIVVGLVDPLASGWLLVAGIAASALDLGLIAADAAVETSSRRFQHGLPPGEAMLHIFLHTVHIAVVAFALVLHFSTWDPESSSGLGLMRLIGSTTVVGGVLVAILHTVLWWRGTTMPVRSPALCMTE